MATPMNIGDALSNVAAIYRTLDGEIWNKTTGAWEPATPASIAAADTAVNAVVDSLLGVIPVPLSLGFLGTLDAAALQAVAHKITAAMKAYAAATVK